MAKRLALVTIGQAPRTDMVPEIAGRLRAPAEIEEHGALDGLSPEEIAALAPGAGEARLVTRLVGGSEAVVAKARIHARLQELFGRLDSRGYDLVVLLCTGHFPPFEIRTPFLEAQPVVDNLTQALTYGVRRIGVMVPHAEQIAEFHGIDGREVEVAHASPYSDRRFTEAGHELADTDIIVMHCMGYTEAMRDAAAAAAKRPVLLSRRMLAAAIDLMLE